MFAQLTAVILLSFAAVRASPIPAGLSPRSNHEFQSSSRNYPSLNFWGGHRSLDYFDNFYGQGHFDVSSVQQTIIREDKLVCRSIDIEIIQQRLVVIQELAKRVITELVCEVETQTIVLEQFSSSVGSFHNDIKRNDGRRFGYNKHIAGFYDKFFQSDGSLNLEDFDFSGSDLGSIVIPGGTNWNDKTSPDSINRALIAAKGAEDFSTTPTEGIDATLPIDGDNTAIPPVDGDNTAIPPVDGVAAAVLPTDGDNTAIPTSVDPAILAKGPAPTDAVVPPVDGDNTAIPTAVVAPVDGDNTAIPTAAVAPVDGDNTAIPTSAAVDAAAAAPTDAAIVAPADGDNTAIPTAAAA